MTRLNYFFYKTKVAKRDYCRGLTLIEFGIVLLAISLFVSGIYSKASNINDEARLYRALDEIILLLTKSNAYRNNNGNYEDISITELNTNGYSTNPITSGVAQNPWGLNYTLAPSEANTRLLLTVGVDSSGLCSRLTDSLDRSLSNIDVDPSCNDDSVLSVTLR